MSHTQECEGPKIAVVFPEWNVAHRQLPNRFTRLDWMLKVPPLGEGRRIGKPVKSRRCPRNGGGAKVSAKPLDMVREGAGWALGPLQSPETSLEAKRP